MPDNLESGFQQADYPHPSIPTFFADGVMNFNNSTEITKFYFFRYDPSFNATGPNKPQASVQAVMSMTAFLQTAAFFNAAIENLMATGTVKKETWAAAQAFQAGSKFNV